MGKIYGNFKDGIFYHCAAIDKDFTSEEWYKYCDDTRYSDAIVATYFGFQWNAHDACRNPHVLDVLNVSYNDHLQIKTAQRKDGLWVVGYDYCNIEVGSDACGGGGSGCWYDGETFSTEDKAIIAQLEYFKGKNLKSKYKDAIQKTIFDRKCKQLTLF